MDEQTKQKRKDIVGWVIYIAVLLAIIITFRCFLMIGRVPSESMEPTLMVHDWLIGDRSEEHTSELQSLNNLVCRLLLEKKKKKKRLRELVEKNRKRSTEKVTVRERKTCDRTSGGDGFFCRRKSIHQWGTAG